MQQPILIIGAGLGGLALGQGLRKLGIPFQIFERDASIGARLQGYRIRISGEGLDALKETLLPEVWFELIKTFAREDPFLDFLALGSRLDLHTATQLPSPNPPRPQASSTPARAADRTTTRRVLLQGIESSVSFNKTLVHYTIDASGKCITAHFSDGTNATGSLLIGVEGSRSVVRQQYAPNLRILDAEGSAITGKTPWTEELKSRLSPYLHQGMSSGKDMVKVDGEENLLTTLVEPFFFDRDAGAKTGLPEQDYVYWALVSKASSFGQGLAATSEDAAAKSLELAGEWHESVRAVWELQDTRQTMMLRITMADPLQGDAWGVDESPQARGRVMIMGDAAHVMSPTGGLGSTAVFRDVARLCGLLDERGLSGDEERRVGLIREFETGMKADARRFGTFSAMGGKNMFGMKEVGELKAVGNM